MSDVHKYGHEREQEKEKEKEKEPEPHEHKQVRLHRDKEELARIVVDCAYRMHVEIGPGLLESVYEAVLEKLLTERGLVVERQKPIPLNIMGLTLDEGFRADLIVDHVLLIELKSVEKLIPVHFKQVLTYLRMLQLPLGLLINFGEATFKDSCKRVLNGKQDFASSTLRVNQRN